MIVFDLVIDYGHHVVPYENITTQQAEQALGAFFRDIIMDNSGISSITLTRKEVNS